MELTFWKVVLFLNALLGWFTLEWAWFKFRRFRQPLKELDAIYPAYARTDAVKWQKWRLYPGALTILIPRALLGVLLMTSFLLSLNVIMLGVSRGTPITGCRKALLGCAYKVHTHAIALFVFFSLLRYEHVGRAAVDNYEKYLGSIADQAKCQSSEYDDERVPKRGSGNVSTVVCNHTGILDIMALIVSPLMPGFTPNVALRDVPILNKLTEGLQSLYVARGGSVEARDQIVRSICERQRSIEELQHDYPPFAIFAEGTSTNGSVLLPFKRGAFEGMRTVIPSYITATSGQIKVQYDSVEMLPLFAMLGASLGTSSITLHILPEFTPNAVMLEKHADKAQEPWQVYAWCLRDLISAQCGLPKFDRNSLREKQAFAKFMQGATDQLEVDGKMFSYGQNSSPTKYSQMQQ